MERYSRPVKGPSYGCSCRCCSITPRGFKIYFEDGEDRNAQHISWFDILKVIGLLAFYVGTSPHTQAALLRRVYNYTDLKRPLLWVVVYATPLFVCTVVYIVYTTFKASADHARALRYVTLGDHLLLLPLFCGCNILTAVSLSYDFILTGDAVYLSQLDLPFAMLLGLLLLNRRFLGSEVLAMLGILAAAFLYLCVRYNDSFFWARFQSSEFQIYMYVVGARLLWSLRSVLSKTLMKFRAAQKHATIHPEEQLDDIDLNRHVFPEPQLEDATLTELDRVFGSSLYDSLFLGLDLGSAHQMNMLGAGLGLLPAAVLVTFWVEPSGWHNTIYNQLVEHPIAGPLLGSVALGVVFHPLAVSLVVIDRSVLLYPMCELVTVVLSVVVGSYYAEIEDHRADAGDGVHPVALIQGLSLSAFTVFWVWRLNSSIDCYERRYAQNSLASLKERLPMLSRVVSAPSKGVDARVAVDLYATGCNWALEERGAEGLRLRSAATRANSEQESLSSGLEDIHSILSGVAMEDPEDEGIDEQVMASYHEDDHLSSTKLSLASVRSKNEHVSSRPPTHKSRGGSRLVVQDEGQVVLGPMRANKTSTPK